jgi:hypothetical protein
VGSRRIAVRATFTENYVESANGEERQQFLRLRRVVGKFSINSVDDGSGAFKSLLTPHFCKRPIEQLSRGRAPAGPAPNLPPGRSPTVLQTSATTGTVHTLICRPARESGQTAWPAFQAKLTSVTAPMQMIAAPQEASTPETPSFTSDYLLR